MNPGSGAIVVGEQFDPPRTVGVGVCSIDLENRRLIPVTHAVSPENQTG